MLDPERGRTKTGQLWAYARDDRPWEGTDPPAVAYVYAADRKAERPSEHLTGFAGVLQVDGYAGYNAIGRSNRVQLAHCRAHVRRAFFEIAASRPVATEALVRIAQLYAIEQEIRGRVPDERRAARQERSASLVASLHQLLETSLARASGKGKLADAIRYALNRWEGLSRFLDDGRIEIDSNTVERSIRPLTLNRKNALFAGSDDGGDHRAVIASLIETCKLNGTNPQAWLSDTLSRLAAGTPQPRSISSCLGSIPPTWPENTAYAQADRGDVDPVNRRQQPRPSRPARRVLVLSAVRTRTAGWSFVGRCTRGGGGGPDRRYG